MRRGRAPALVVLLVLSALWFLGGAGPAHACSCAAPPEDEHGLHDAADVVVVGRATSVTEHDAGSPGGTREYAVAVEYVHKGEVASVTPILTSAEGSMCGTTLPIGELYKVYAYRVEGGALWTTLCSGNRPASAADFQPLGPPTTPATPTSQPPPDTEPPPTEPPPETTPPVETTTVAPEPSTTSTAVEPAPTTTAPEEQASVAVDDDASGGSGGAGRLVAGGGFGLAGAAVALVVWRGRRDDEGVDAGGINPEAPAAP